MMVPIEVVVRASATWTRDAPPDEAPFAEGLSFHPAPDPPRPPAIDPGTWRRLSRLGRLAAVVAVPVLATSPVDLEALFVVFGTGIGEFSSSIAFLRSLHQKGTAGASPLAFQTSVHNAAPGQLAIALGLRGPMETVCAGEATAGHALLRAALHVAAGGGPALVLLADDLGPDVQVGLRYAGVPAAYSEGAAAFLLGASGGGTPLRITRSPPGSRPADHPVEVASLGVFPVMPGVALAARMAAGGAGAVELGDGIHTMMGA